MFEAAPIDWMSTAATARLLGIHQETLYRWIEKQNGPPVYTFHGQYRYRRSEVEAWIAERRRA